MDEKSPESTRISPENGGTSPEKGGISPVAGGRTRRGRLWAWVGGASLAILAFLFAAAWWLWPLVPPRQTVQPDAPEAWRALMRSESRPILLASKGDAEGAKTLLKAFPSLSKGELRTTLQALLGIADMERVDPALIDAFLNYSENLFAGDDIRRWIPAGKEARHLPALLGLLDKPRRQPGTGHPMAINDLRLWSVASKIAASGDREALERCREAIREAAMKNPSTNPGPYWDWADFLLTYYADDPVKGFRSIEKEYPKSYVPTVQRWYLQNLGKFPYYKAAVDLWLGPLPDDQPTTSGGVFVGWDKLQEYSSRLTPSPRTNLARGIAGAWPKIPQDEKARLSEGDRDQFLLALARSWEGQGYTSADMKPTREMLLRLLQEPGDKAYSTLRRLHEQGEKDLRSILIQEALQARDPRRMRESLNALYYLLGGIPEEVAERAKTLMETASSGREDALLRKDIARFLSEPTPPVRKPAASPSLPPYRDSRVPWALRRNRTAQALAQMRALQTGLSSYIVDWNVFPPRLSCLTTPIGYVDRIPPDACAGFGPYGYATTSLLVYDTILGSAGPDGVRDVSLLHFLLAQVLQGAPHGGPGSKTLYVRLTPRGYEFLEKFESGADILAVYDDSMFRGRKYSPSRVLIP